MMRAESDDDLMMELLAAAVVTIQLRARSADETIGRRTVCLPEEGLLRSAPESSERRPALAASIPAADTYAAGFALQSIALPALKDEDAPSALAQCVGHLHATPDWPVLVMQNIERAVREAMRSQPGDSSSPELSSIVFAVVQLLAGGGRADRPITEGQTCQAILEACARHVPTAVLVLEALVDVACAVTDFFERELHAGRNLVLDRARAHAILSSAHIFAVLESLAVIHGGEVALADLPSTRKLLLLEQRIRDSDRSFQRHFPLIARSVTQCAWVMMRRK